MLVLTRRRGEKLLIGKDVEVMVTRVIDGQVRLAVKAPPDVAILRAEILERAEARKVAK